MSESDDTDVLLLIPPDFFIIHSSDSDDSLIADSRGHYGGSECTVERQLVDELVNQVNDLESRISLIESKDNLEGSHFNQSFDCAVSLDSSNFRNLRHGDLALRFYSMSSTGYRFGAGSSDNVGVSHLQSTPVKVPHPLSLPASPAVPNGRSTGTRPVWSKHGLVQKPMTSQGELISGTGNTGPSYRGWQNVNFMGEIDDFLESKKKHSDEYAGYPSGATVDHHQLYTRRENIETIPKYGLKSFSDVQMNESVVKPKPIGPLQMHSLDNVQSLELQDVNKLLDEMEATQLEIDNKLQSKEAQLDRYVPTAADQAVTGHTIDNIGSISGEGFGIREFLKSSSQSGDGQNSYVDAVQTSTTPIDQYSSAQHVDSKLDSNVEPIPVNEPNIVVSKQNTELGNDISSIPDRGFGLVNWYKNGHQDIVNNKQNNQTINSSEHRSLFNNREVIIPKQAAELMSAVPEYRYEFINWPQNGQQQNSVGFQNNPVNVNAVRDATNNKEVTVLKPSTESTSFNADYRPGSANWSRNNKTRNSASLQSNALHPLRQAGALQNNVELSKVATSEVRRNIFQPPGRNLPIPSVECGFRSLWPVSAQHLQPVPLNPLHAVGSDKLAVEHRLKPTEQGGSQPQYKKRVEFANQTDTLMLQPEEHTNRAEGIQSKSGSRGLLSEDLQGSSAGVGSSTTNLLSLSDLWGSESTLTTTVGSRSEYMPVERKLEEERYRRQHCEHLIQHLQSRLLEEQQRLAVAVRVDKGKDQAILQLQNAWAQLVSHWRELEEQRHMLANTLHAEQHAHKQHESEMGQKLKRYEQELSKVLDLAQGYKDKGDTVEREKCDLEAKLMEGEKKLVMASQEREQLVKDKEQLQERLQAKQQEAQKEQALLIQAKDEVNRTTASLSAYEAQLMALKEENGSLKLRLKEEHAKTAVLEEQRKSTQAALDESRKKEKFVRDELKEKSEHVEKMKVELRDFYQEQVEEVVRDKLKEFQSQLDAAETSLQREMEQREKAIAETASKQVKNILEKHQVEIRLMEEKHKEELQLYQLQLMQATQQISQLQVRLQSYSTRKTEIVEKLHGMMETQWQEALRIIGDSSPVVHSTPNKSNIKEPDDDCNTWSLPQFQTMGSTRLGKEQLQNVAVPEVTRGFKPSSYMPTSPPNLHIPSRDVKEGRDQKGRPVSPLPTLHPSEGSSTADEMPFSKEGQLTYRGGTDTLLVKPSSEEEDLKKYIQMLLNRSPGNPVSNNPGQEEDAKWENVGAGLLNRAPGNQMSNNPGQEEDAKWEKVGAGDIPYNYSNYCPTSVFDGTKTSHGRSGKPPWK